MRSMSRIWKITVLVTVAAMPVALIGCWDFARVVKPYVYEPQPKPQVGFDPTGERNLVEVVYLQSAGSLHELVHEAYDPTSGWQYDTTRLALSNSSTDQYTCSFSMASSTEKFLALGHSTLVNNDRTNGVEFYEWAPGGSGDPALDGTWQLIDDEYYTSSVPGTAFFPIEVDIAAGPLDEYGNSILYAVVSRVEDGGTSIEYYEDGVLLDTIEYGSNYGLGGARIAVNSDGTPYVTYGTCVNFGTSNGWGGVVVARRVAPGKWQRVRLENGERDPSSFEHDSRIGIDAENPDKIHVAFYIGMGLVGGEQCDDIRYTTVDFSQTRPVVSPVSPYETVVDNVDWNSDMEMAMDTAANEPVIVYDNGEDLGSPVAIRRTGNNWVTASVTLGAGWRASTVAPLEGTRDLDVIVGPYGEVFSYWRANIDESASPDQDFTTYTVTQNILSWRNWLFFYDDFEDGNYDGWTPNGGSWYVTAGGALTRTPATGDAAIYRFHPNPSDCPDTAYKNHEFVVDFDYTLNSTTNGVDAFLEEEEETAGNGLYLEIRSGTIKLKQKSSPTALATYTGSSAVSTWYSIHAELNGATVNVYRSTGGGARTKILGTTAAPTVDSELLTFVIKDSASVELDNISVRSDKGNW